MQLKAQPLPDEDVFAGFNRFLCEKFDRHDTVGWAAQIAYYTHDDGDAFDEFFRLLDEYRLGPK